MSQDPVRRCRRGLRCQPAPSPRSLLTLGGSSDLLRRAGRLAPPARAAALLGTAVIVGGVSGCSGTASNSAAPPSRPAASSSTAAAVPATAPAAASAATSGPALTGFGATVAQWKAAHRLDRSVPARDAYRPQVGGEDTWQVVTVVGGRVISYTLNVAPSSLRSAEARARREMPADTRVLWARTVAGSCSQEQFESATLAAALGDGQVNVEFDNASSGNAAAPITEELFSTWDAPTVARAPAC